MGSSRWASGDEGYNTVGNRQTNSRAEPAVAELCSQVSAAVKYDYDLFTLLARPAVGQGPRCAPCCTDPGQKDRSVREISFGFAIANKSASAVNNRRNITALGGVPRTLQV